MSKYNDAVLGILSKEEIKSTNQVLAELQAKVKKVVNWHVLYRILMELQAENKLERIATELNN